METTLEGTFFQEGDQVRLKDTGETGRVNATAGGVVYVLMDSSNESKVFAAYVDEDAAIELATTDVMQDNHNARPFSKQQSEQWLIERTYHAQLRDGRELSVADLTRAMLELTDYAAPLSSQSSTSHLPESELLKKSTSISVPLPTWRQITREEARASYRQGSPVLLYGEHTWEHAQDTSSWRPNKNMRVIIFGNERKQPDAVAGTEYAVSYLDPKRGTFSNDFWRAWFSPDPVMLLDDSAQKTITFFGPSMQFPYSTHYTVIDADGHSHEYADRAEAMRGFATSPLQEGRNGSAVHTIVSPQFCYYHDVTTANGTYRLEFFGPRMNENGYRVKEAAGSGRENVRAAIA